jgi:hypothetical protein
MYDISRQNRIGNSFHDTDRPIFRSETGYEMVDLMMPCARKFLRGGRGAAMTVVVFSVNREHT